ncbi:g1649 [Coccomyxa viridis]|uniref:G1649 protein n=1 Tax=Coccomyxa viridis TaxID=1274662 RepID=A0ABP1FKM1_9CHLO
MHDKTIDVNPQREKTSAMLFQRMAWLLRRVDPATQLRISMINAPVADDSHDDTEDWESLMSDLHAVIKASQHLPHMKALKWDVQLPDLDDGSGSWRQRSAEYVLQCQRWQDQLLLSAPSMTALSLGPNVFLRTCATSPPWNP